MVDLTGLRLAVVGAGVFGLACALTAAWSGAEVVVYESGAGGRNASTVAAGMLAPAFETAIEGGSLQDFSRLRIARDLWPEFARRVGAPASALDRSGAMWVAKAGEEPRLGSLSASMRSRGAATDVLSAAQTLKLQPGLAADHVGAVFSGDDWRLDPLTLTLHMVQALSAAGARLERRGVRPDGLNSDARQPDADVVLLAVGASSGDWIELAPELKALQPIKGQILHFQGPPVGGPTVRDSAGYVTPQSRGPIAGSTMEPGIHDTRTDPRVLAELRRSAAVLFPGLASEPAQGLAGVRMSTADGLPIIGRSSRPGVMVAAGARRNGWLLAPLAGAVITAILAGGVSEIESLQGVVESLAPERFS